MNLEYALGERSSVSLVKKWIKITEFKWGLQQMTWVWSLSSRKSGIDSVPLNSFLRSVFYCSIAILICDFYSSSVTLSWKKKVCQLLIAHLKPWSAFVLKSYYTGLQHQYVVNLPPIGAIFWVAFIQKEVILVLLMINFLEGIRHFLYLICIYPFAPLTLHLKAGHGYIVLLLLRTWDNDQNYWYYKNDHSCLEIWSKVDRLAMIIRVLHKWWRFSMPASLLDGRQ